VLFVTESEMSEGAASLEMHAAVEDGTLQHHRQHS
jgi:hypothetical protein